MKRAVLILLAILLASGNLFAADTSQNQTGNQHGSSFVGYVPNMIIVQLEENALLNLDPQAQKSGNAFNGVAGLDEVGRRYAISRIEKKFAGIEYDLTSTPQKRALARFFKVVVEDENLDEIIAEYQKSPMVTRAYKIPVHEMFATPNDPLYTDQWHYYGTYGIDADEAWDMETGDATVVVGILDSGVKYDHGDLGGSNPPGPADNSTNGNIWVNDLEIPGNGIDDDGNGYVDDVIGYDFLESSFRCKDADCYTADNDPMDGLGHGTHCSGTVSAINNNGYRVAGVAGGYSDGSTGSVANGVKILPCRIGYKTSSSGVVDMAAAADAMVYVGQLKERGVNVAAINCSWGSSNTADLAAAVDFLVSTDVMVVVAAGNSSSSSAPYLNSRSDCMSVGATDVNGNPASFSNYGSWVEIAAPGVGIISTVTGTGDLTANYSGTSMAAPHICGVVGLLESYDASLSAQDKWNLICDPANVKAYNETKYVGVGIASVKLCLDAIGGSSCTNPPVANFSGAPTSGDYPLTVNFTDLSTNGPTSWDWNFGDGSAHVYTQNPSHTYTATGTYTVTLTATNACGSDFEVKTGYITVTEPSDPPVANFSGTPTSGAIPLTVNFTDLSVNGPTTWDWDFGDGSAHVYTQNPSHTYTAEGFYTVTLTVTNSFGSDTEVKTNYIDAYELTSGTMHVDNITVTERWVGTNCRGQAVVVIKDASGAAVANATVYATATGFFTENVTGITGSDGSVELITSWGRRCTGEWCFEVTDVTHASNTYASGDNVVTKACESGPVFKGETDGQPVPNQFSLGQNYPNPFNPTTEITFSLPAGSQVRLEVFNIRGQRVATLADGVYSAGVHTVTWDASNVSSGIYLYRLDAGEYSELKKMLLLK